MERVDDGLPSPDLGSEALADGRDARPNDPYLVALGCRVREMRSVRGMSRKVLSRVSGISERYIAQLESGQGNVSILLLRKVGAAIGARLEDLLAEPGEATAEWLVVRDLLRGASAADLGRVRALLGGGSGQGGGSRAAPGRIALIGLRGAGKSTLGRLAAERLGWPFVELNREIERATGLSVPEIFALYGQEGYRRFEQSCLRSLVAQPGPTVLATGGGIVAEPLTFDLLLQSFFTVWLQARPEQHMARVRAQGDLRPMADDRGAMQELRAILEHREALYGRASAALDTSGLSVEDAASRLVRLVSEAGAGQVEAPSPTAG